MLLSIAERAGAVRLRPAGRDGLLVELTGKGSPQKAQAAIQAARNRSWEAYRSIERYAADGELCRRRQILDHFGDPEQGRPTGRCCDVCDPDEELRRAMLAAPAKAPRGSSSGAGGAGGRRSAPVDDGPPVDVGEFDRLRAWRLERAEGKPAYTVATDAVLREVLRRRPAQHGRADGYQGHRCRRSARSTAIRCWRRWWAAEPPLPRIELAGQNGGAEVDQTCECSRHHSPPRSVGMLAPLT